MTPLTLAMVVVAAIIAGLVFGFLAQDLIGRRPSKTGLARWPKDWDPIKSIFTKDPSRPGYMAFTPEQAMRAKAMPFGRTYPRLHLFPDKYPFKELRRLVEKWSSYPIYIPYKKRFTHFSVLGPTGKGKSTAFAIPILAYGAMEEGTAYFAIDVKTPQFARTFGPLYKKQGKPVLFFDCWSLDETMAFEPLWRATPERLDTIAEVIATYSASPGEVSESGNSEFFKDAAIRLMRACLDLAQFWPRRYCNLPCVQQLIGAGGDALKEAFQNAQFLLSPFDEEIVPAVKKILAASDTDLRSHTTPELTSALKVIEGLGYPMAHAIKKMRALEQRHAQGGLKPQKAANGTTDPDLGDIEKVREVFWAQLRHMSLARKKKLDQIILSQGEFITMPPDTRNSVVSTLTNKTNWFKDPNIAKAFSRDELDVQTLIRRPCLFLVGAPMAKLRVGSMFVCAMLSNLTLNAVFQRGMDIERKVKGTSKHGVFFILDEFPQLMIKSAPQILATFRGFMSGLCMIFQDRGQLRQLYKDDATTMEGNTVHKVLLQGAHEETCEFYATKAIGEVQIKKPSGGTGDKKNDSYSFEKVPRMSTADVRDGRLNGNIQPGIALSVGGEVPPFPFKPIPYYEDPTLRKLLRLKKHLVKVGNDDRPTWKFWEWKEEWRDPEDFEPYMRRRKQLTPAQRAAGTFDAAYERAQDPFTQFLDYFLGDAKGVYDELTMPKLSLGDVGVFAANPIQDESPAPPKPTSSPFAPPSGSFGAPPSPPVNLVPTYTQDLKTLVQEDFEPEAPLPDLPPRGGSLAERIEDPMDNEDDI